MDPDEDREERPRHDLAQGMRRDGVDDTPRVAGEGVQGPLVEGVSQGVSVSSRSAELLGDSRVAARPRQRPDRRGGRRPVAETRVAVPQADHRGGQIRHGLVNGEPVGADGVIEVRGDSVDQCMGGLVRDDVLREGAAHRDAPRTRGWKGEEPETARVPVIEGVGLDAGTGDNEDLASGKRPVDPAAQHD